MSLRPRLRDLALAAMFGALIYLAHDSWQRGFLFGIAFLQLIEGRVSFLDRTAGRVASVVLQLALAYLLVGLTDAIDSPYYLILLLPILSTASYLGFTGTLVSTIVAIGAYLSFLLYVDWSNTAIDEETKHIIAIRCLLPAVAALLVNGLSEAIRTQSARYKATAEELAKANHDLVEAEAAVRRSDRLAALGQLSAGLAHELRNPLGSIRGSAELLSKTIPKENSVATELAGIIRSEVDRTNSLVSRFLDFARPLAPRRELVDVATVIDRAASRAGVNPIREYAPDLPPIPIDPELMEQVFLNLLTNARQASEPDKAITVRTACVNNEAEVSVLDQGCGIPPDKLDTIFNPFVTTKHDGVGLGLAIVNKIVDGHGGSIKVESEPGSGSTFRIHLPLSISEG